jgi:hypothetical protein
VADSIAKVSDQFRSISIYDLSVRRGRHTRDVLGVCYTQYLGPLLERLIGALRAHQGVRISMENLHTWTLACVARVRVVYEIRPLVRSVRKTLRTGLVCSERCVRTRTRETCVRNSRECGPSLEDVRIRAGHYVCHHGSRRPAHNEDLRCIAAVLAERIIDHADDAEGISTAIVCECRRLVNVPTVAVIGSRWIDKDKAVCVSVRGQLGTAVPLLASTTTWMQLESIRDCGLRHNLGRLTATITAGFVASLSGT